MPLFYQNLSYKNILNTIFTLVYLISPQISTKTRMRAGYTKQKSMYTIPAQDKDPFFNIFDRWTHLLIIYSLIIFSNPTNLPLWEYFVKHGTKNCKWYFLSENISCNFYAISRLIIHNRLQIIKQNAIVLLCFFYDIFIKSEFREQCIIKFCIFLSPYGKSNTERNALSQSANSEIYCFAGIFSLNTCFKYFASCTLSVL